MLSKDTLYAFGYRPIGSGQFVDPTWINKHGDTTPAPEYVFSLEQVRRIAAKVGAQHDVGSIVLRAKELE